MMTFGDCCLGIGALLIESGVDGSFNVSVEAWGHSDHNRVLWKVWLASRSQHIYAGTPERLLEKTRDFLQSEVAGVKMSAADVRIE